MAQKKRRSAVNSPQIGKLAFAVATDVMMVRIARRIQPLVRRHRRDDDSAGSQKFAAKWYRESALAIAVRMEREAVALIENRF